MKFSVVGNAAPLKINFDKVMPYGVTVLLETVYSVTRIPFELTS
jgi:hypothetical protein